MPREENNILTAPESSTTSLSPQETLVVSATMEFLCREGIADPKSVFGALEDRLCRMDGEDLWSLAHSLGETLRSQRTNGPIPLPHHESWLDVVGWLSKRAETQATATT